MDANSSENGMVSATISAPRTLPRNKNKMIDDQHDALGQIVQHRVRGEVHQIAAIQERHDLYARAAECARSALSLSHEWPPVFRPRSRLCAAARCLPPRRRSSMILPSRAGESPCQSAPAGSSALASPWRCPCTRSGVPFCALITVCANVLHVREQANRAHVDLLQSRFDKAAAGVHVVVRQLLLHLADVQSIGNQLVRDRPAPDTRALVPPKLDTSTTFGTDLNCFSSVQSSSDFKSIRSYVGLVLFSVYQ